MDDDRVEDLREEVWRFLGVEAYGLVGFFVMLQGWFLLLDMGLSPTMSPSEQGAAVGREWETLPEPRPSLSLEIVAPDEEESVFFNLGPHPPRLWPEESRSAPKPAPSRRAQADTSMRAAG